MQWTEGKIVNLMNVMAMHTLYGFSFLGRRHVLNSYLLSRIWFYLVPVVFTGKDVSAALLKQLQVKCYDFVVNGKCRYRPWYRIPVQLAQQPLADGGLGMVDISAALLARRLSMVRAIRASGDVGAQALELALAVALPHPNTGRTHIAAPASVQRMLQAAPQCDGVADL